jgi:AcrR family transcriptional regulator
MGISERKARDKQAMKKRILATAMKLFLDEGFGNVSIRRIAAKIEYSPATIYLYFKDKDEILFALHTAGFEELYKRQQEVIKLRNPAKRLRKHGEIYIKFALENPEYYNLMFIMRSPVRKILEHDGLNVGLRSYELFKNDVQSAIDSGYLKNANADIAAFGLWSQAHGIVALILRNRCTMMDKDRLPEIAMEAFNFILSSMNVTAA